MNIESVTDKANSFISHAAAKIVELNNNLEIEQNKLASIEVIINDAVKISRPDLIGGGEYAKRHYLKKRVDKILNEIAITQLAMGAHNTANTNGVKH